MIDVLLTAAVVAVIAVTGAGVGFLLGRRVQKHTQRIERELEEAERAKTALLGYVLVGGHALPLPNVAWAVADRTFSDAPDKKITCLVFGPVTISSRHDIFVGRAVSMPVTEETHAYAAAAWTAYRNQVVRAALGEST